MVVRLLDTDLTTDPTDRTDELIAELRDRVRSLEDQMGQEREANRENRRIIAALTSRIPELEAPADSAPGAPGSPETAPEPVQRESPFTEEPGAQEAAQPRSWWRRMFRG